MAADALLRIKVITDATAAAAGLDNVGKKATGFQGAMQKAALPAAAVGAALVAVGAKAIKSASDLQQAQGAVESVFGAQSKAVEAYAAKAADSMGLSAAAYENYAALVGAALQNSGFTTKQSVEESNKIMQRAADMAATYGGTTSDAVEAINAAVSRGEFDPLEKYAVSLNATAVNAELAKRGQDDLTGAALKHAKAQIVLEQVYGQSSKAAGQFARESDTAAGSAAIASANFENASAALGQALLPAAAATARALAGMAKFAQQNSGLVLALGAAIGTLVTAILLYNAAMKIAAIVQLAFNAAVSANVIFLIIVGIIALIAVIIILIKHWDDIKRVALAAWDAIKRAVGSAAGFVRSAWGNVASFFAGIFRGIRTAAAAVWNWIKSSAKAVAAVFKTVWKAAIAVVSAEIRGWKRIFQIVSSAVRAIVRAVATVFRAVWRAAVQFVNAEIRGWKNIVSNVVSAIKSMVRNTADVIKNVFRAVRDVIANVFNGIRDKVSSVMSSVRNIVSNAVSGVKNTLSDITSALKNLVPAGLQSALAGPFNAAKGAINAVKDAINNVISAIGNLISKIAGIHWPSIPSGIGKILGKVGLSAAAPSPGAGLVRPRVYYAPAVAGVSRGAGARASVVGGDGAGVVININGALDPDSVARQIRRILSDHDIRIGRAVA